MSIENYKKFLSSGYFDENGIEKNELFLKYPKEFSEKFSNISYSQIRGIYERVNVISLKLKSKQYAFKNAYNDLSILFSKINDKYNKGVIKNDLFLDFFFLNLNTIKNEKDLYCFEKHLLCICNFYPKNNKQEQNKNYKNNGGYKKWID